MLVDDHSRYLAVRLLRKKSEALAGIRSFVAEMNAGMSKVAPEARHAVVGTLHTDNAGEFLSREFAEFLDSELIDQSLCPPHVVHQLNGTAERAIRSIMQQVRSNLVASGAPITFWPYAAIHAVDVLNRVRCPTNSSKSSYEILTGIVPSVMDIMPFGCRVYAVKPTANIRKTNIESHSWVGINLGREPDTPGAYNVWIPDVGRKVVTTEAYFDEGLMPWRPKGEQRIGPVLPTQPPPTDDGAACPPALSGPAVDHAAGRINACARGHVHARGVRRCRPRHPRAGACLAEGPLALFRSTPTPRRARRFPDQARLHRRHGGRRSGTRGGG